MTDNIKEYILNHNAVDPNVVAKAATGEFGKFVPVTEVVRVLNASKRQQRMGQLKGKVAETLDDKFKVMESVSYKLLAAFNDDTIALKERIEAAKELRQWTRMGIDLSGIHDEESDTLFVIDAEWGSAPSVVN